MKQQQTYRPPAIKTRAKVRVNLPGFDITGIVREIQSGPRGPVICITTKDGEYKVAASRVEPI